MNTLKDEDIERLKKWINMVGTKMSFDAGLKLSDIPAMYKELHWIQTQLIPLMESHVLELVETKTTKSAAKDKK